MDPIARQHGRLLEPAGRHRRNHRRRLARHRRRCGVDADGYLWFRGRKKQIIIHDGSNICPQEVEESLAEHPAVAEAGVIGIHDIVHGENVRAYVTLSLAPSADPPELIQFARARVGYKAPERSSSSTRCRSTRPVKSTACNSRNWPSRGSHRAWPAGQRSGRSAWM